MIIWTICFIGLALWTLVAWGAAGLLGSAETLGLVTLLDPLGLGANASAWTNWLQGAGSGLVIAIWAVGALALLLGTAVISRLLRVGGRLVRGGGRGPAHLPPSANAGRGGGLTRRLLRAGGR